MLEDVRRWIADARRIVALTGAGISTESGIPDFRGPQGVWTKDPKAEKLSNIHYYMSDPEVRRLSWQTRLDHPASWENAVAALSEDFAPIDDLRASAAYRLDVARALLRKALTEIGGAPTHATRVVGFREASHVGVA